MKRLIINADDLGADEARNAGIFEGIQAGAVTSASILPNGPALQDALHRIRSGSSRNVSWGAHLNLSEGKPVSTSLPFLLGPDGMFQGKGSTQRLLMHREDQDLEKDIAQEIDAQISLLEESRITLRHLDGHQHVHVFPAVLNAMVEAALRHHIPWVRIPLEPEPGYPDINLTPSLFEEGRLFSGLGGTARPVVMKSGLHITDHFRGLYLKGRLTTQRLESVLLGLPEGLTELMVHPGRQAENSQGTPFSRFSTVERRHELETLLTEKISVILQEHHILLIPFPESPS